MAENLLTLRQCSLEWHGASGLIVAVKDKGDLKIAFGREMLTVMERGQYVGKRATADAAHKVSFSLNFRQPLSSTVATIIQDLIHWRPLSQRSGSQAATYAEQNATPTNGVLADVPEWTLVFKGVGLNGSTSTLTLLKFTFDNPGGLDEGDVVNISLSGECFDYTRANT